MKNSSIWKKGVSNKCLSSLNDDISCDILVIGGGMAGLMSSYYLSKSDSTKNIVLIDKDKCGEGASSRNTGKITFMQGLVYGKLKKNYSFDTARLYLKSQKEAILLANDIVKENNIDCNMFEEEAYVFINDDKYLVDMKDEMDFYNDSGIECEYVDEIPTHFSIKCGIKTNGSYSFNPYKFMVSIKEILKNKIKIYENTMAISIDKKEAYYLVTTGNDNVIKSKYVVVATQYPFFIVPYFVPFKTIPFKSFIVAGKYDEKRFQAINEGKNVVSFNYTDYDLGYLLYSRRSHSVSSYLDTRDDRSEIVSEYKKYFGVEPLYYFQNHDIKSYDNMPFIGKIDKNMYVLTAFNKWGNSNGIIGGKVISDLIYDKENEYVNLFNPKRGLSLLKIKNLIIYNTMTLSRYILNKVISNKTYYDDNVRVEYIDGKKCGIYIDKNGEHIVSNICPHMKCNLVFNYVDKTWDCPCHASRFDIDGNVISGPSVYNIKIDRE